MTKGKIISKILLIYVILSLLTVCASEGGVIYDFTEEEVNWVGENEGLDFVSLDIDEEAYKGTLYNVGWASRYGGVAIQGSDLELKVSATKNRFIKLMVKVDELGSENAFDNLKLLYWYKGDQNVTYGIASNDALSALNASSEYITITFDLGWANEEDKIIDKFRMDMFSSSLEKAAISTDGGQCGFIYIKYIAFFDTQEKADAYEVVISTKEPATPSPDATIKTTPVGTESKITTTPDNDAKTEPNYTPIILIVGVVVMAIIIVMLIIFIPKGRKR